MEYEYDEKIEDLNNDDKMQDDKIDNSSKFNN